MVPDLEKTIQSHRTPFASSKTFIASPGKKIIQLDLNCFDMFSERIYICVSRINTFKNIEMLRHHEKLFIIDCAMNMLHNLLRI